MEELSVLLDLTYPEDGVIEDILGLLPSQRFFVLAIDGRSGSGKTTLGHYSALRSGYADLDGDFFIDRSDPGRATHSDAFRAALEKRKRAVDDRPIILGGIFIAQSLARFGFKPDLLVRVIRTGEDADSDWRAAYETYEQEFVPDKRVFLPCDGALQGECPCQMLRTAVQGRPCAFCGQQADPATRTDCPWEVNEALDQQIAQEAKTGTF